MVSPEFTHERRQVQRVALVSLGAAILLASAELAAGLASGSLSLLSGAAHSALDAGVTALTFAAVRIASRPPDEEHPYGHGKAENIATLFETAALFALSIYIAIEAVSRLQSPTVQVEAPWYGFAVVGLNLVVDANRSWILRRAGRRFKSPALEADALHFTADLLTSAAVLVGLLFVRFGITDGDAYASLVIAAYVCFQSIKLGRRSVDVLMDRAPTGIVERITELAAAVPGVEEVRRVRVRYAGGHPQTDVVIAISRRAALEKAHGVSEEVERAIAALEPGADIVVHVEPLADEKVVTEQVEAIALRKGSVEEVHNIFVTSHPKGLHISLHAKFPGSMTLAEAHGIAEELEKEIATEIEGVERVDTHLEPLGEGSVGVDVTVHQSNLVKSLTKLAEAEPEVSNCHEVVVTETKGTMSIVMHCEAAPGLSVNAIHKASDRIETQTHRRWPEIQRVTVHFEPAEH